MLKTLLTADLKKIKRTWILFLVALGPIGVVLVQTLNYTLRYDYLTDRYADDLWGSLLGNILNFTPFVLMIGMAIITSLLANIEHQTDGWKQMLVLPIRKIEVFGSKCLIGFGLLLISCTILFIGSVALGLGLGFGTDIPWNIVLSTSFYPYLASLPFLAVFIWLAIVMKNQSVVITIGILATVVVPYGASFPFWNPISWPYLTNQWDQPMWNVFAGIALALVLYVMGSLDFKRRDVNGG